MNKHGWLVVAWLGLIASTNALASNQIGGVTAKSPSSFERPQTVAAVNSVSYIGATTGSGRSAAEAPKLPATAEILSFDSSTGSGNTYVALVLAGLGALAISATRRRAF